MSVHFIQQGVLGSATGVGSPRAGRIRRWDSPVSGSTDRALSRGRRRSVRVRQRRAVMGGLAAFAFVAGLGIGLGGHDAGSMVVAHASAAGGVASSDGANASVAGIAGEVVEGAGRGGLVAVADGYQTVRVMPGDTLWSIAARTFPDADPREAVVAFREANGDQLRTLQVGARLVVPSGL